MARRKDDHLSDIISLVQGSPRKKAESKLKAEPAKETKKKGRKKIKLLNDIELRSRDLRLFERQFLERGLSPEIAERLYSSDSAGETERRWVIKRLSGRGGFDLSEPVFKSKTKEKVERKSKASVRGLEQSSIGSRAQQIDSKMDEGKKEIM